ncbi:MAG: bacterio-opsin activator domain-containing protein [Halobaculum sp.]
MTDETLQSDTSYSTQRDRLETCPYGLLTVRDGTVVASNDPAASLLNADRAQIRGTDIADAFPMSVESTLPRLFADGTPTETHEFEEYYPELERWLAVTVRPVGTGDSTGGDDTVESDTESDDTVESDTESDDTDGSDIEVGGAAGPDGTESASGDESTSPAVADIYVEDVTERVTATKRAAELREEVEEVLFVTDLLSEVLVGLVDATDREEVTETICRKLGETDAYEFAWLGEREPGGGPLRVEASAGDTGEVFRQVQDHLAETPERAAVERGTARVIQPITEADNVPAPIRQAAFADGIQSFVAVPLTYGDTVYGVVGVYASGKDAFSERTRRTFETLGSMAGFAINAARNQTLLFADTITEFTFDVTDRDAPLVGLSTEFDATFSVDGTVPQGREAVVCYLTATDCDPEAVVAHLDRHDGVADARVVADGEGEETARFQVTLGEETPLQTVATLGVTVGGATFEDGTGRIRVELPSGEEVRQVGEAIRRRFDADTVAKVERDRQVTTAGDLREELGSVLTDRQETALRTAYLAGYFESPRDSTAEEVGEALDITGSTLLHHLRTGQRKLLDAYFEADDPERVDTTTGLRSGNVGDD